MTDEQAMQEALKLALRGTGKVSPNPRVGAVILKEGEIIGSGWHEEFGRPHAEVNAINSSEFENFEECTLVITMEPCTHFGKTPPCADLIIDKKFARVVIGMEDPNPIVKGKGIEKLKEAGVDVVSGVLEEECKWMNRTFTKYVTENTPYIVLKAAQSLDGCIATSGGESKWISSEESRKRVHILRAGLDAVLVGKTTVLADNPELTVRHIKGRDPRRVILDSNLSLPPDINVLKDDGRERTIICCSEEQVNTSKADTLKSEGINILSVETNEQGHIILRSMLKKLNEDFGIASILVEGGSSVFSSFLAEGLVDELQLFIAPKIIGNGLQVFGDYKIDFMNDASQFDIKGVSKCGGDIHIIALKK